MYIKFLKPSFPLFYFPECPFFSILLFLHISFFQYCSYPFFFIFHILNEFHYNLLHWIVFIFLLLLQVVWMDNKLSLLTLENRRVIDDVRVSVERPYVANWNLHIRDVTSDDQGLYMCQINTDPVKIKQVVLYVQGKWNIFIFFKYFCLFNDWREIYTQQRMSVCLWYLFNRETSNWFWPKLAYTLSNIRGMFVA